MYVQINGTRLEPDDRGIPVENPVTGQILDKVPALTEAEIDLAVTAAAEGQRQWSAMPQMERNRILRRFAELFMADRENLAQMLCTENGKRLCEAKEEFDTVQALVESYCDKASHLYGVSLPNGTDATSHNNDVLFTRHEPLGIVACLLPFNFPVELFGHKIAPALAVGNAVIIKPPTACPLTVIHMVDYLHKAGVPPKAAQVVTGRGSEIGDYLAAHPGIQAITMTGSTETGGRVRERSSANMTRCYLELGGNDVSIVLKDADLDLAVEQALESRVVNAGQICCASKRFLVQKEVEDSFVKKLVTALRGLRLGDPMHPQCGIGSMIAPSAADKVTAQVRHTVEQGANLVYGGEREGRAGFVPAVLTGVTKEMDIAGDMEVFGAVFPIISFQTPEEAVEIANQSAYGLNGAVFSKDYAAAVTLASKLETGCVVINGGGNYRTAAMPFGGYKKSGIGREGSRGTLLEMTQEKTFVLKNVLNRF